MSSTLLSTIAAGSRRVGASRAVLRRAQGWRAMSNVTTNPMVIGSNDETERTFVNPAYFVNACMEHGTEFFTGVPDSLLADACAYMAENVPKENHCIAANEGTALALAAGHHLATGKVPLVYLQNSGLGNTVNPLLSLCDPKVYCIPALLMIGWRGEPGKKDEPQHGVQGAVTPRMLYEMGIPFEVLRDYEEGCQEVVDGAYKYMKEKQSPFALLVKRQTFVKYKLQPHPADESLLYRESVLEHIIDHFPTTPLVTTTGFTSREMFELREAKNQGHGLDFLTVGSMGHCSSIALGVALAQPEQEVLCIDGDGAAIMHMGAFVTAGHHGGKNFKHILVNNGMHDSVGGQVTGGYTTDFCQIALACGYKSAVRVSSVEEINDALANLKTSDGPAFVEIRSRAGARRGLGRPTTTTVENKHAFMQTLGAESTQV